MLPEDRVFDTARRRAQLWARICIVVVIAAIVVVIAAFAVKVIPWGWD